MLNFLIVNLFLLFFLLLSFLENKFKPKLGKNVTLAKKLPAKILLPFIILAVLAILSFLLLGSAKVVKIYLYTVFSFLVISHSFWLSIEKKITLKIFMLVFAAILITARFMIPNDLINNLFLIFAIAWLGPLFTQTKILTLKRFVIISCLWFLYDIFFVWLTPTASNLATQTELIGFSLAISFGGSFLGTGDLLFANLLISILKNDKWRMIAIGALIISNLLFGYWDYLKGNTSLFPLLVLWVPVGFIVFGETLSELSNKK